MSLSASDAVVTPDPAANLRAKAVRGLKAASLGQAGKTIVDMLAQLALIRLLAPEHFGVFAFAQALTGFISCFTDVAGTKFIVREGDRLDRRGVSTVFWIELGLGLVVGAVWLAACIPLLAAFGKPEQVPFAQVLALWIIAERVILPRALLDRGLQFGKTNLALFVGVVVGAIAAITAAAFGAGPWSFIVNLLVRTFVAAAGMWIITRWHPLGAIDWGTVRALFRFGGPLMLTTALTFAYTNLDYIIVGQVAGYSAVGFYYAAYRYPHYLHQFNIIIASVLFPSFARAKDDAQLARGLRLVTRYASVLAMAPVLAMWTEGETILRLLLGEKWLPALFPFQCFTTLAAARLAFIHWGQVYVAKGHTHTLMWVSVINTPLILGAAWAGVTWWGIEGAALGVTLVGVVTLAICCGVLVPRVLPGFRYGEALRPVLLAGAGALAVWLLGEWIWAEGWLGFVGAVGVYIAILVLTCRAEFASVIRK